MTKDYQTKQGAAALLRKRWLGLALVLAVVAVGVWAKGRGASATDGAANDSTHADEADSVVVLDSVGLRLAQVSVLVASSAGSNSLIANGTITYDANHVAAVAPRVEGRVVSLRADLGQTVAERDTLASIESSEVGQMRGDRERARVSLDVARRNYEREQRLFAQEITPQKELLEAENAFRLAQADLDAATSRLAAVGADSGVGATFGLTAPVGGTIVERSANPGQLVGPSSTLFTVANLRHVWINVDVYEADLSRIQRGAAAVVTPSALPGEEFTGRVTYAGGVVDTSSRTFKVRVALENEALRLRPGMFAQVSIATTAKAGAVSGAVAVPEIAVQEVGGRQVVFVETATAGRFIARGVNVGARVHGGFVIQSGLKVGERYVGRGSFQLKAQMIRSTFGEGH